MIFNQGDSGLPARMVQDSSFCVLAKSHREEEKQSQVAPHSVTCLRGLS